MPKLVTGHLSTTAVNTYEHLVLLLQQHLMRCMLLKGTVLQHKQAS